MALLLDEDGLARNSKWVEKFWLVLAALKGLVVEVWGKLASMDG